MKASSKIQRSRSVLTLHACFEKKTLRSLRIYSPTTCTDWIQTFVCCDCGLRYPATERCSVVMDVRMDLVKVPLVDGR